MEGSVEKIAEDLVAAGPEKLTEILSAVDGKLVELGASLQAVVDQIGGGQQGQGQPMQEEGPPAVVDGGQVPWGESAPEMAMPAPGSRQRISMR
jgi:hypothetical protein